ncbi:MAG: choline-sulfatase [Chlamydiales bacterium]|jgi:choline-sulfatase
MKPRSPSSPSRPTIAPWGFLLVLASGALLGLACGPGVAAAAERPNVLFLTVDTLRADHLTPYGYERATSPAIESLASGGVLFESAQASSSWTLPALASVMTGQYTSTHGCWKRRSRLAPGFETLPEVLRDGGYDTACVVSHIFLARTYGLQQGFVHFDTAFDRAEAHEDTDVSSPRVTRAGIEWIENKAASADRAPWFLWLHYFDPHFKYVAHEGQDTDFGAGSAADLYDGEILFTDRHIGRVLQALDRTGLARRTVVVLFADHGEEFDDHGGEFHGHTLHEELTRVPLIIRAPGVAPGRIVHPVRTVDIMPTVLELVGLGTDRELAGRSLVPSLRGEDQDLPALAELRLLGSENHFDSLVAGDWKLIARHADGFGALYRIADDPHELRDVAALHPEVLADLQERMAAMIALAERTSEAYAPVADLDLSGSEAQQLRALGYADSEDEPEDQSGGGH